MNIQKKEVSVNLPPVCVNSSAIVDSDAIVNDSKPDLLKVIKIDSSVRMTKTEILNGKMMLNGHVSYKVLYQPEDGSGICSIHTGADFSHMEENPQFEEGMYHNVTAGVEHVEAELINSRKIKIKSVVSFDICAQSCSTVMLPLAVDGDNLQTKTGEFCGFSRFLQKRDIITVSDTLSVPTGKPNIGTLLKSDVSLCNKDVKIISGKVIIKGEFIVCTLYLPEGTAEPDFCSHTLPFTEILDAEGITEEHRCRVKTEVEECDFSLATDSDGDIRIINANIRMGVKMSADAPVRESVVTDLYSLTDNLSLNYKTLALQTPLYSSEFDHTLKSSVRPSAGGGSVMSVYNVDATPAVTSAQVLGDKVVVDGYVDLSALCITSDKNSPLLSYSEEIPFKIEAACENATSDSEASAEIELSQINYNLGASGDIDLRIVLSCSVNVSQNNMINIVDSVESSEMTDCSSPSIVLYFVQKGDTLWDIAKRYHTKTEYIEELNGADCNPPKCGSQLLIPRG